MATVTQEEFDTAYIRRSQEDHKRIMDALKADGTLSVVAGDEITDPEPEVDEEGNPVTDEEGNPVMQAPQPAPAPTELSITVDNVPKEGEPVIPEGIVVEVAPGTQNAAAPFPEESK
jgi:hypothetical protein